MDGEEKQAKLAAAEKEHAHNLERIRALEDHPVAFHDVGADNLAEAEVWDPTGDYVLLRSISDVDVLMVDSSLMLDDGDVDHYAKAIAYVIVAVGPVIKATQEGKDVKHGVVTYAAHSLDHLVPGNHCIHLAGSADKLEMGGGGRYHCARAHYVAVTLKPEQARPVVAHMAREAEKERHARVVRNIEAEQALAEERRRMLSKANV